jgi:PKD repeat protein/C1A family cysteine protease
MKKILSILVVIVFLASSISMITTGKHTQTEKKEIEINNDEITYEKFYENGQEIAIVNGKYILRPFPDKTPEQLEKMIKNPKITSSEDLPSSFSWKSFGGDWTTGAKDQENCGSCWAFGALGAMESAIDISSGNPNTNKDLSEQYVLSCLPAAGSCSGGFMSDAIEYIESTATGSTGNGINGCPIESCMPYQAVDYIPCSDKCTDWDTYSEPPQENDKLFQIENYGITSINPTSPSGWDTLKTWVYNYGPISVDIYASSGWSNFGWSHHSPTDVYEGSESGTTNHAQVLCGWVDDPDVKNGGYWILKNSWGTGFGYGGFINVAYGCLRVGDRDVTWVTTPQWPVDPDDPGVPDVDMAVFANFDWDPEYAHTNEEIEFADTSEGDVVLWNWDFDGDGIIDSTDNDPEWEYTQEGEYEVTLKVTGEWGLSNTRTRLLEVKSNWPPVIDAFPDEFVGHGLSYHFDARYCYDPDGSIVAYHWDFGDGESSDEQYLDHTFPTGDTIYEVTLTLTDDDGGTSTKTCNLKIDQTLPPETTIHHGFGATDTDWYSEIQRISFTATDWTEVIDTFYRVDGGSWKRYNVYEQEYIPVSSEGEHTVEAYSIDFYGNEETPVSDTFAIDKTDPTLDVSLEGDMQNDDYIGSVTVTLTGDDDYSGLKKIRYTTQTYGWTDYTGPFEITKSCYLNCIAEDNAGNTYEEAMFVSIEGAPTTPKITGPSRGAPGQSLDYTFSAIDVSPSYEDNIFFYIDWGDGNIDEWVGPYDSNENVVLSHVFAEESIFTIKAKAKDQAGAESQWGELTVTMPRQKTPNLYNILQLLVEYFPIIKQIFVLLS